LNEKYRIQKITKDGEEYSFERNKYFNGSDKEWNA